LLREEAGLAALRGLEAASFDFDFLLGLPMGGGDSTFFFCFCSFCSKSESAAERNDI